MSLEQVLVDLERAGWDALTQPGRGARFYAEHLTDGALMIVASSSSITRMRSRRRLPRRLDPGSA